MVRAIDLTFSVFKYLLAIFMIVAGIATMFNDPTAVIGPLGLIYNHKISLVMFGVYFTTSGLVLLYGKIRKKPRVIGWGLMMIYLAFFFSMILQGLAFNDWISNGIASAIVAALYLRWKYRILYR